MARAAPLPSRARGRGGLAAVFGCTLGVGASLPLSRGAVGGCRAAAGLPPAPRGLCAFAARRGRGARARSSAVRSQPPLAAASARAPAARAGAAAALRARGGPSLYSALLGPLSPAGGPPVACLGGGLLRPLARGGAPRLESEDIAPEAAAEPEGDPSNRALLENVRAPGRANPEPADLYDLVVIGAGVAGLISCIVARQLGCRVALVERHYMGGDCLNTGCVPSKALLASAKRAAQQRQEGGAGTIGSRAPDFLAAMRRLRRVRADISEHDSIRRYTEEVGVDVFSGAAAFSGPGEVQLPGVPLLRFRRCVVATGAGARVPVELKGVPHLTSSNIWNLMSLPPRLLVLGSGPIGLELAQAMARLGSSVTVVSSSVRPLGREEPVAADAVWQALRNDGVAFLLGARVTHAVRTDGGLCSEPFGTYEVTVTMPDGRNQVLEADAVLNATGRVPNTRGLALEKAAVAMHRDGSVAVNEWLQTSNPNVYAAGDCLPGPNKFTHAAEWQARVAVRNALLGERADARALLVPRATYTEPEVASVGATEAQLRDAGAEFETYRREAADVDRNRCDGVAGGLCLLHVSPRGRILGSTIVGPGAGDHISEVTLCMQHGLGAADLAGTMHPYPTAAEVVRQAAQAFVRSRIFQPQTQRILHQLSRPSPFVRQRLAGSLTVVELSRPEALNAADLVMVRDLADAAAGAAPRALLLRGTDGGAFCAGGDVKSLAKAVQEDPDSGLPLLQLRLEYRSIMALHRHAEENHAVCFMDGICMGYGLGLAKEASFRVATERSLLAMPECAIGILPDVGFSHFARSLPKGLGLCMALTGWRVRGAEALGLGLATHFVPSSQLEQLQRLLESLDWGDPCRAAEGCRAALAAASAPPGPPHPLLPHIARVFGDARAVCDASAALSELAGDGRAPEEAREWAAQRLLGLEGGCPRAQEAALRLVRLAELDPSLERALDRDLAVMSHLLWGQFRADFLEGVRAALVDKDRSPRWSCTAAEAAAEDVGLLLEHRL